MRILILSDVSGHMRGGVPAEARALAAGLRARRHEVAYGGDIPIAAEAGVRHFALPAGSGQRLREGVAAALAAFQPDLVHVLAMGSRGLHALRAPLRGRPWALTCHSIPPHERKLAAWHGSERLHYAARDLRFLPHGLAWRSLLAKRLPPAVVTHSQWVADIVRRHGYPLGRIRCIALGADLDAALPLREAGGAAIGDAPRFVTVAGLAHTKGQHDALRAMQALRADFPRLSYRMVGEVRDPSYLAHLKELIAQGGLAEHVRIEPDLDEAAKQAVLQAADLYLQPSHEEGFCLAYLEAAARVPRLVGTDTGAIRLVSTGDAGMQVVPPRSPQALAAAIRSLLRQPLPADLLPVRMQRLRRDFPWRRHLDEHERLYEELVEAPLESRLAPSLSDFA
jgi:glycosyltransferase involved in cell wall biosynthesis